MNDEPFPWHLGVYDAHCHPTDTMTSIRSIPSMKTRILTVMATRSQDQDLVGSIAETLGVKSATSESWPREECIVPCFGWHPWFAHQMYLETGEDMGVEGKEQGYMPLVEEKKIKHYAKVFKRDVVTEEDRSIFLALPDPTSFPRFLAQTRVYLQKYPYALVGEIGLDRGIRIPEPWPIDRQVEGDENLTQGGREGRKLTSFKTDAQHQKQIFKLQLQLAAEMKRAVSIHGVQAHGLLFETIKELYQGHERKVLSKKEKKKLAQEQNQGLIENEEDGDGDGNSNPSPSQLDSLKVPLPPPYPPRICLHSYSGDFSNLTRYLHPSVPIDIFVSFSTAVNLSDAIEGDTPAAFADLVKRIPDHCLLVESDLHVAGDEMDRRMEEIVRRICKIKGWTLEEGVLLLGGNWKRFAFG